MGKFSTYRYLELKDDTSPSYNIRSRSKVKPPRRLKRIFIFLIVLTVVAVYLFGILAGNGALLDEVAKNLGYKSVYHYAMIIDAGSSGTRVLAYRFRVPFRLFGEASLDLEEEYFEQVKPGLSWYADDPAAGAQTIVKLIKSAEFLVPTDKRNKTPLIVRATAGLRLLHEDKAQSLISHVAEAISAIGYDTAPNAVDIMDGSDEGIFIWYTVNLLHKAYARHMAMGNISDYSQYMSPVRDLLVTDETMAALDLGGGSTQITYQLNEQDAKVVPSIDQYVVSAGTNISLFTHSYLNLGLMAARFGIFKMEAGDNQNGTFESTCVDPIVKLEPWTYGNKKYSISGAPRKEKLKREQAYKNCHQLVKKYTLSTMDWKPQAPRGKVAAMSYFYDVAADAGLIDVMNGGVVTIRDYRASALKACSASNVEQPWACIDLVYMVTLLQDAYGIREKEPISLYKKVNGHEVSWALGLAYTTVMNRMAVAVY